MKCYECSDFVAEEFVETFKTQEGLDIQTLVRNTTEILWKQVGSYSFVKPTNTKPGRKEGLLGVPWTKEFKFPAVHPKQNFQMASGLKSKNHRYYD